LESLDDLGSRLSCLPIDAIEDKHRMSGTELWLARHGQTDWNREGRYQGSIDLPLNEAGLVQAHDLAAQVDGVRLQAIYTSDLQRARATAQVIAGRWSVPLHAEPRLREVRLGAWEGLIVAEIQARYGRAWEERQIAPLHTRPPQGESIYDLAARVWPAVDAIAARHAPGPVLIVSHGLALATLVCRACGIPLDCAFQMIPANCTLTVLDWQPAAGLLAALAPAAVAAE
jgi:broad specificity phosphatase PhoE